MDNFVKKWKSGELSYKRKYNLPDDVHFTCPECEKEGLKDLTLMDDIWTCKQHSLCNDCVSMALFWQFDSYYEEEFTRRYGFEITEWIMSHINRVDDPYQDNLRVAVKGNEKEEEVYREQVKRGCCGYADFEEKCPIDGKIYKIGLNYGH